MSFEHSFVTIEHSFDETLGVEIFDSILVFYFRIVLLVFSKYLSLMLTKYKERKIIFLICILIPIFISLGISFLWNFGHFANVGLKELNGRMVEISSNETYYLFTKDFIINLFIMYGGFYYYVINGNKPFLNNSDILSYR
jgi:hypothetical protein